MHERAVQIEIMVMRFVENVAGGNVHHQTNCRDNDHAEALYFRWIVESIVCRGKNNPDNQPECQAIKQSG